MGGGLQVEKSHLPKSQDKWRDDKVWSKEGVSGRRWGQALYDVFCPGGLSPTLIGLA